MRRLRGVGCGWRKAQGFSQTFIRDRPIDVDLHIVLTNFIMGSHFISQSLRTRGGNFSEIEDEK